MCKLLHNTACIYEVMNLCYDVFDEFDLFSLYGNWLEFSTKKINGRRVSWMKLESNTWVVARRRGNSLSQARSLSRSFNLNGMPVMIPVKIPTHCTLNGPI